MDSQELTQEQVLEWRTHPVTQLLLGALEKQIQSASDSWVRGNFMGATPEITHRKQIEVLTRVDALRGVIEVTANDIKEAYDDE